MKVFKINNYFFNKRMLLRSVVFVFLLFASVSFCTYASATDYNDSVEKACSEALCIIQPMNTENLDVTIGDIFNVIDDNGEHNGYSLGYYVDNEPYGYAIYSIASSSIREFVFCPGVENLYLELYEKAEEDNDADEDNLINGIVYDGGIDYSVYDLDGNKVNYSNNNETEGEDENIEAIIDSEYVEPESLLHTPPDELCKQNGYWDVYDSDTFLTWNIVPDSGLAMIPFDFTKNNFNKYGCTISSVTGLLNWLGYGTPGSNYLDLWNNNPGEITQDPETNLLLGGYFLEPISTYLNNNYFSNTSMYAYMDRNVTFDDVVSCIGSNAHGEKAPFSLSIWIDKVDENGNYINDTWAHTVTVVSYIKTTQKNYVGIFNGWDLASNDNLVDSEGLKLNVNNSTSYLSVRYIDFDELSNRTNVSTEAMMLNNVSSRNIKEVNTNYVSGNSIELSCQVPNGTASVRFPTWTMANGQDDLVWHQGTLTYGTVANCSIDLNDHNKESGLYITHIYAYDSNGNILASCNLVQNDITTTISNCVVKNKKIKGYTVECVLPTGTKYVKFPTWSQQNGQDDIVWHQGVVNGGKGSITIDVSDHGNCGGDYVTHIYAYDKNNNCIANSGVTINMPTRTSIANANVTYNSSNGNIVISCDLPVGTDNIKIDVYALLLGSSGYKNYSMSVNSSSGFVSKTINKSDFYNAPGEYHINIYAYDSKGNIIGNSVELSKIIS